MRTLVAGLAISVLLLSGCSSTSEPESIEPEESVPAETQEPENPNKEACLAFPSPGGNVRAGILVLDREYRALAAEYPSTGFTTDLLYAKLEYEDALYGYLLALYNARSAGADESLQPAIERTIAALETYLVPIEADNVYELPSAEVEAELRAAELEADTICGSVN